MQEPTISCPQCSFDIKLTESLAAPLVQATRQQYEQKLADKEAQVQAREAATLKQLEEVERAKAAIDEQVAGKLNAERDRLAAEEAKKAKALVAAEFDAKAKELATLQEVLKERDAKLADAQKTQADLLKQQRELEDARREVDLTVEKKVRESLESIRAKATIEAEDRLKLTITEREEQIAAMKRQIEDLQKRAAQGSQQLQGEALELQLEQLLGSRFPLDSIEPVPKGEFGGDILQRVVSPAGRVCGTILWETKRTKNWSDGWLNKLRDDQRAAKADLAVLITDTLPKSVETFDQVDGIWVTERRCAVPVAIALRQSLIELAHVRQVQDGQQGKMELIYAYLTGPRFRHRVEAIVEKFSDMQDDLNKERKAMVKLWAKRESQIQGVIESTVGMYGDLQGIAGRAMQEIESLDLLAIENSAEEEVGGGL